MWNVDDAKLEKALASGGEIVFHDQGESISGYWVTHTLVLKHVERIFSPDGITIEGDTVLLTEHAVIGDSPDSDDTDIPTPDRTCLRVADPRPDFALLGLTYLEHA